MRNCTVSKSKNKSLLYVKSKKTVDVVRKEMHDYTLCVLGSCRITEGRDIVIKRKGTTVKGGKGGA